MTDQLTIKLNTEKLSSVIKGNLIEFYNQALTPEVIKVIAQQLLESIDDFVKNKDN